MQTESRYVGNVRIDFLFGNYFKASGVNAKQYHYRPSTILRSEMQLLCSENGNLTLQNCNGTLRETAQKKEIFSTPCKVSFSAIFHSKSANFNCNSAQVENPHKIYYIMYTGPLELRPPMIPSLVDPNWGGLLFFRLHNIKNAVLVLPDSGLIPRLS